jgi:hypothetical protein
LKKSNHVFSVPLAKRRRLQLWTAVTGLSLLYHLAKARMRCRVAPCSRPGANLETPGLFCPLIVLVDERSSIMCRNSGTNKEQRGERADLLHIVNMVASNPGRPEINVPDI